jgi:leucyl-tRNA synthetase
MPNHLNWYRKRGGAHQKTVTDLLAKWLCMMAPFTPHIAEELWEIMGNSGFVTDQRFPEEQEYSKEPLEKERLLINTVDDIHEILKVTGLTPSTIYIYTAPEWKCEAVSVTANLAASGELTMGAVMKELMSHDHIRKHGKKVGKFAQSILKELQRGTDIILIDEYEYLCNARDFIEAEFEAKVHIFRADDDAPDPGKKKNRAEPRRPAIYTE